MEKITVIHVAITPLAGAPIRLIRALNKYTKINARLVNLNPIAYRTRTFPEDLIWGDNKEECMDLLSKADIVHFHHHNFDVFSSNNPFNVNFKDITQPSCRFIYQYHSAPQSLAIEQTLRPSLVIPHCPERYFPDARVVPNIIDSSEYNLPNKGHQNTNNKIDITFAPSMPNNRAWDYRWHTKGARETCTVLNKLSKEHDNVYCNIITDKPYSESILAKYYSDIVVDDVVTGSFHQGGFEGLSLGKLTVCNIDERCKRVLLNLLGTSSLPFINCRLEELECTLKPLFNCPNTIENIGLQSKQWMDKYYAAPKLIDLYTNAYSDLLESETLFAEKTKMSRKADFGDTINSFYTSQSELIWQKRKRNNATILDSLESAKKQTKQSLIKAKSKVGKILPRNVKIAIRRLLFMDGIPRKVWTPKNKSKFSIKKDSYKGKRCFIVGTGPSIANMDLSPLNNEHVITVNRGFLLKEKGLNHILAYGMSDVGACNSYEYTIPLDYMDHICVFGRVEWRRQFKNTNYISMYSNTNKKKYMSNGFFQFDIKKPVAHTLTVVLQMLQVAVYLGFKDIYFIGVDNNFLQKKNMHFYKDSEQEKHGMNSWGFDPTQDNNNAFSAAHKILKEREVSIYNAGIGGNLNTIERVDFSSLF